MRPNAFVGVLLWTYITALNASTHRKFRRPEEMRQLGETTSNADARCSTARNIKNYKKLIIPKKTTSRLANHSNPRPLSPTATAAIRDHLAKDEPKEPPSSLCDDKDDNMP